MSTEYFKTKTLMRATIGKVYEDEYWDDEVTIEWRIPVKGEGHFTEDDIEIKPIEYNLYDPETDTTKKVVIENSHLEQVVFDHQEPGFYPEYFRVWFNTEGEVVSAHLRFAAGL